MSGCSQDATFGPISSCRSFDFTLTFESSILSLLPTSIFFVASLGLIWRLRNANRVLTPFKYLPQLGKQLCIWKVVAATGAAVCDAIALAAWVSDRTATTPGSAVTMAALTFSFIGSFCTIPLVYLEFFRRLHASPLLPLYLSINILCDAARVRTFAFIELQQSKLFFAAFTAAFAFRIFSWFLETAPKEDFVERAEGDTNITAEETSSFFARLLITSVDPVLIKGFRTKLTIQSLGSIHSRYDAERLYNTGLPHWEKHRASGKKHPLFRAMFGAFGGTLLAPVLPCVVFSLAQIAQPTLVSAVITFVESYQTGNVLDRQPVAYGYGLVGAYFLVFLASTLSWSLFQMSALRCSVAVRGFLVQMIYRKTLKIHSDVAKEVGTGSSTSLMSVDIERMVNQLEPFHLLYSSFIIVMVGLVILYYTVGISFVATIIVAVFFILSIPTTTRSIPGHQKAWSQRTDMRVKLVNSVIRNIKAVKLSGYENILVQKLELLRDFELKKQKAYLLRILAVSVYTNWLRSLLSVATLVTYTIVSQHSSDHTVNTATFFTTIAVLAVVTEPLLIVGQRYASIMAATASLARIQEFLMKEEKKDDRLDGDKIVGQALALGTAETVLLRDMTFQIPEGKTTMLVGQVGSGKSTFLHGLMGEINTLEGTLSFPSRASVGFCAQDAWLRPGDSIRANIQFMSSSNPALYRTVVKACALDIDFRIWPEGDKQKAQGLSGGQRQRIALARALYARPDILILDDVFSALDKTTEQTIFQALFGAQGLLKGKTVILATNAIHRLPSADLILLLEDNTIGQQGTYEELSSNPGAVKDLLALVEAKEKDPDVSAKPQRGTADDATSSYVGSLAKPVDDIEAEMDAAQSKRGPFRVFATAGGFYSFCLGLVLIGSFSLVPGLTPVYIQAWTSGVEEDQGRMYTYLGGYVAIEIANAILLSLALWYAFVVYNMSSSRNLHRKEVRSILATPLGYFEDKPIGRILSRFSQDLFVIDFEINNHWMNFFGSAVEMVALAVILSITQPYIAPIIAGTFVVCIALQRFYLRTSRQVRRMDFIAKSPLYDLFAQTIDVNGLKTIRAIRGEDQLSALAASKGNVSQTPYYLMMAVKKWLNLVLGLVVTVINCMLVLMAVLFRGRTNSGLLAVSLVQATSLVFTLNHVITSLADFETGLVAVSRVQEVIELPKEEDDSQTLPPPATHSQDGDDISKAVDMDELPMHKLGKGVEADWITAGSVRFQNVVFKYRPDLPPALRDLSFRVQGGTKVGIVGRSGCGKSTALQALFRMVECESGGIFIDGIDVKTMPRAMLRNAMTIIPQDPLLLELSIRENMDLEGVCTDQQIWDALEQTQCKALVAALPDGLDSIVTADGGDFSRGERQLLALARALLRNRKLLVLDEASSSLDVETDALLQQVIRTAFARCTVITVAHRLQTLMDYDSILVLSAGELVEQGSPQALAANPQGAFSQLLRGEQAEAEQGQVDEDDIREI